MSYDISPSHINLVLGVPIKAHKDVFPIRRARCHEADTGIIADRLDSKDLNLRACRLVLPFADKAVLKNRTIHRSSYCSKYGPFRHYRKRPTVVQGFLRLLKARTSNLPPAMTKIWAILLRCVNIDLVRPL